MFLHRSARQVPQLISSLSIAFSCSAVKQLHTDLPRNLEHWKPLVDRSKNLSSYSTTEPSGLQETFNPWDSPDSPDFEYDAFTIAMAKKRKLELEHFRKNRKYKEIPARGLIEGSNEEVLEIEVAELLRQAELKSTDEGAPEQAPENGNASKDKVLRVEKFAEYEVDIVLLSSTGDGLAYAPLKDHIIVVPFTVPGDRVVTKIYKTYANYSHGDFVKLITPSSIRKGTTPQCKYFSECGGCQLQMISYDDQLQHKKTIVQKAFRHFSGLPSSKIPTILDTMGSPKQYGYRTKLSPHFEKPRRQKAEDGAVEELESLRIGFNRKGMSRVMDIEQCPIGTEILNEGMPVERERTRKRIDQYKQGATLLLRESTVRLPTINSNPDMDAYDLSMCDFDAQPVSSEARILSNGLPEIKVTYPTYIDRKTYVNDMSGLSTEYIGQYKFINRAGSFFQNNNSILRPFTDYIREQVNPTNIKQSEGESKNEVKYLLDAYCGSGLFTITLSPLFSSALGIDIDRRGIEAARLNAEANNIPNAGFIDADASNLFADVPYPPDQSLVVIDPPRRGASEDFLRQLCQFKAKRVIYVSCNVHSQARDVGMIVRGFEDLKGSCRYEIESLRGFDFFPQTGHVEGVCVLNRVDEE